MKSLSSNFRHISWPALALCFGLGLGGCVTDGKMTAAQRVNARRIGVVSAMGDQVHARTGGGGIGGGAILEVAGLIATKNHHQTAAEFQVDTTATAAAVQSLRGANPGAQVLNLQAERGSVKMPGGGSVLLLPEANFSTGRSEILEGAARRLGAANSLDLVVFVVPWPQSMRKNNAVPDEGGYGYGSLNTFGAQRGDLFVYVNYAVGVFDGKTGQRIALRNNNAFFPLRGMRWRGPLDRYTEGERQQIGEGLRLLIGEEVFKQLRELGLSS